MPVHFLLVRGESSTHIKFTDRVNTIGNILELNDMSCRWNLTFLATGDLLTIKGVEEAVPSFFDVVIETGSVGGGLMAQVAQYYGAAGAMGDLIASYPDLLFNGVMC